MTFGRFTSLHYLRYFACLNSTYKIYLSYIYLLVIPDGSEDQCSIGFLLSLLDIFDCLIYTAGSCKCYSYSLSKLTIFSDWCPKLRLPFQPHPLLSRLVNMYPLAPHLYRNVYSAFYYTSFSSPIVASRALIRVYPKSLRSRLGNKVTMSTHRHKA